MLIPCRYSRVSDRWQLINSSKSWMVDTILQYTHATIRETLLNNDFCDVNAVLARSGVGPRMVRNWSENGPGLVRE